MRIHSLLPVLLLLGATSGYATDIYKWQENGKTVYGEFPPLGTSAQLFKRETGSADGPQSGAPTPAPQPDDEQTVADVEKYKQQRQQNCETAKRNLGMLKTGGHHRIKMPDGSIQYLDETQTKARVKEAEDQVRDYCT